jgi:hypothetical protein
LHATQTDDAVALSAEEKVPAAHGVQAGELTDAE